MSEIQSNTERDRIAQESYNEAARGHGRNCDFRIDYIGLHCWNGDNELHGIAFDAWTRTTSMWKVNLEERQFYIWNDGKFLTVGGGAFEQFNEYLDDKIERELGL